MPHAAELETISRKLLQGVFMAFAERRQPRTSALVKGARIQVDSRVATGEEACRERDASVIRTFKTPNALENKFDEILREPF